MELEQKYKKFIKEYEKVDFTKDQQDVIEKGFILTEKMKRFDDLESLFISNKTKTIDYEFLFPYEGGMDTYSVNVFSKASKNNLISIEDLFEKVLPKFIPYIPQTIIEKKRNPQQEIKEYSYPGVAITMRAIEEKTPLQLYFGWGA